MVEIGAGGGSIARVDACGRIQVGPRQRRRRSPGPACYGRGGTQADGHRCRPGARPHRPGALRRRAASARSPRRATRRSPSTSACRSACRRHGGLRHRRDGRREHGQRRARARGRARQGDIAGRTLIAFGGAAPLHAAALAEKLGIDRIIVPAGAGVGSAIGFLRAPVAYEVVRSALHARSAGLRRRRGQRAARRDARARRDAVVRPGAPAAGGSTRSRSPTCATSARATRSPCRLPAGALRRRGRAGAARAASSSEYTRALRRASIPGARGRDPELALRWSRDRAAERPARPMPAGAVAPAPAPRGRRAVFDPGDRRRRSRCRLLTAPACAAARASPGPALSPRTRPRRWSPRGFDARDRCARRIVLTRTAANR